MKRTERDDYILERIQKNIKKEEKANLLGKLKSPLPSLNQNEINELMKSIEEYVIKQYSKYKDNSFILISAYMPDLYDIHDVFKDCSTYLHWAGNYDRLMRIYNNDIQKEFANNWLKKEVTSFLNYITNIWNSNHKTFIMYVIEFGIKIEKKE